MGHLESYLALKLSHLESERTLIFPRPEGKPAAWLFGQRACKRCEVSKVDRNDFLAEVACILKC
jgi:hypothetical protein